MRSISSPKLDAVGGQAMCYTPLPGQCSMHLHRAGLQFFAKGVSHVAAPATGTPSRSCCTRRLSPLHHTPAWHGGACRESGAARTHCDAHHLQAMGLLLERPPQPACRLTPRKSLRSPPLQSSPKRRGQRQHESSPYWDMANQAHGQYQPACHKLRLTKTKKLDRGPAKRICQGAAEC